MIFRQTVKELATFLSRVASNRTDVRVSRKQLDGSFVAYSTPKTLVMGLEAMSI